MLRSKKSLIIIAVAVIFILVLPVVYFTFTKSSDNDYSSISDSLKAMTTTKSRFINGAKYVQYSADIDDAFVSNMSNMAGQYTVNLSLLSSSTLVTNASQLKTAFDQNKSSLTDYEKSANDLVSSFKKYRAVVTSCTALAKKISQIAKLTEYDTAAKGCTDAVTDAKSAPYAEFNTVFLTDYLSETTNYFSEYRKVITQTEAKAQSIPLNGVSAVNEKLGKLASKKIDLKFTSDPTDALNTLSQTIKDL